MALAEEEKLSTILWKQVENQENCDFIFRFENKEGEEIGSFAIHSWVLVSKSCVFCTMITGHLKETSPVTLKDTTPGVFKKFIGIIYEQDLKPESMDEAQNLYYLGDKYCYPLAAKCAKDYMLENITAENADRVFESAKLFKDKALEDAVWNKMEQPIANAIKALQSFGGTKKAEQKAFNETVMNEEEILNTNLGALSDEIEAELDLNHRISLALKIIETLNQETQKIFQKIIPMKGNEIIFTLKLTSDVPKPAKDIIREAMISHVRNFYNVSLICLHCSKASVFVPYFIRECKNHGFQQIYDRYKHYNLEKYSTADIHSLYENLRHF